MISEAAIFWLLVMAAFFVRGLWMARRLHRLKTRGACVSGSVIECNDGEEVCNIVVEYYASGGMWKSHAQGQTTEYKLGQEVAVHFMPDAPSHGEVINFVAWRDTIATVVLPIIGAIAAVLWPYLPWE